MNYLLIAIAGFLGYKLYSSSQNAADNASAPNKNGWKPMLNPVPLDYDAVDKYAQMFRAKSGTLVLFGLTHDTDSGPAVMVGTGSVQEVSVVDDQRLWRVRYEGAASPPVRLMPDGSGSPVSIAPPAAGAEFILFDTHLRAGV